MECKSCGYILDEDVEVCPNCGAETVEAEEISEEIIEDASFEDIEEKATENIDEEEEEIADITDDLEQSADEEDEFDGGEEYEDAIIYDDEISGEYADDIDEIVLDDEMEKGKMPKAFKITAAVILAVIIALGAGVGCLKAYNRPLYNKVLSFIGLSAKSTQELNVYTAKEGNAYNVYATDSKGNTKLLLTSNEAISFVANTNFVAGEKNIFYLDGETLFAYSVGDKHPTEVSGGVNLRSLVLSPSQNKVLYIVTENDKNVLYSYVMGKKSEKVGEVKTVTIPQQGPSYGFDFKNDNVWYVNVADDEIGELYYKNGRKEPVLIRKDVAGIKYISYEKSKYNMVYYARSGDNHTLNMVSAGKDISEASPKILSQNYIGQAIIPLKNENAVVYIDVKPAGEDEIQTSIKGTMCKQSFDGGDAVVIDEDVAAMQKAQQLFASLYSVYDYSTDLTENDAILYLKNQKISISYDGQPGAKGADGNVFSFEGGATIEISKDSNTIAYMNNGALEYAAHDGEKFSEGKKVADNVALYKISGDGAQIAYIIAEETSPTGVLSLYNIKTGKTVTVSENAAAQFYFTADSKTLLYSENYNEQTQLADMKYYKNGKNGLISKEVSEFIVASSGVAYIVKNINYEEQYMGLFKLNDKNEEVQIFDKVTNFNFY